MALTPPRPESFGFVRSSKTVVCLVASVVLSFYILVLVNGIAFRHPGRLDLTEENVYSLSERTRAVLQLVNRPIRVVVPFYEQEGNERLQVDCSVLRRAYELLRVYALERPLIQPAKAVNVHQDPSGWQLLCKDLDLVPTQVNRIFFFAGEDNSLRDALLPKDLAELSPHPTDPTAPPQITRFRGEEAITAAIDRLLHPDPKRVYFSRGHGELEPGTASPIQGLVHDLKAGGFLVETLSFNLAEGVPDDCDLLIIAAPYRPFDEREIAIVHEYLENDGRLLVTLGASRTGLEGLLARWGIDVLAGRVQARAKGFDGSGSRREASTRLTRSRRRSLPCRASRSACESRGRSRRSERRIDSRASC
jgi:hypothetical protein